MSEYRSVREQVTGNCYKLINDSALQAERRLAVMVWLRVHNDVSSATDSPVKVGLKWSTIRELTDE